MNYYLSMFFYISVILVSCGVTVHFYRKAAPAQRRKIVLAGSGALAVSLVTIILIYFTQ